MQPREWFMLAALVIGALVIAVIVTLWSIKQMAYSPKKQAPPKPVLTAAETAAADCATPDDKGRCRH